jgi:hypothetical protein
MKKSIKRIIEDDIELDTSDWDDDYYYYYDNDYYYHSYMEDVNRIRQEKIRKLLDETLLETKLKKVDNL